MNPIFEKINSRLWIKIMLPVSFVIILAMGISLWFNVKNQKRLGMDQLDAQNKSLTQAVEGGMFDALSIGDNDTVRQQFKRLGEEVANMKVYVYDFNKHISFSTDLAAVGKSVDDYINETANNDVNRTIKQGKSSHASFITSFGQEDYIIKNEPILNERRCYHCHGKRDVLGGISVLSSMVPIQQGIAKAEKTSVLISSAGLMITIFSIWLLFVLLVNKKVGRVLATADRLGDKDFTHIDEIGPGDEINHILNRLNFVTKELGGTIRQVVANSTELAGASNHMNQIAQTLDASSSNASDRASQVSVAAEEMSVTNKTITSAMDDASANMQAFATAVSEMGSTSVEISKNASDTKSVIDELVTGFEQILSGVKDLGQQAHDVDAVTDEIRTISEQVSLLALNAKIEAARAGEAGKGFAVVAQEITELALDSNQATLKADEKLAAIKSVAENLTVRVTGLAENVKNSDQAITGIAAAVEEQNVSTQEISQSIVTVSEKITEVNENVTQGAIAADEIAQSVVGVDEVSADVGRESRGLSESAHELSKMAQDFSDMMKQFKV